jgi:hypothetical protein
MIHTYNLINGRRKRGEIVVFGAEKNVFFVF